MSKLLVYLDENLHADLKELALKKRTTMSALVRYALDKTFEDDLDLIAGERGLEEYLRDPSSAVSLDVVLKEMGIALPNRRKKAGVAKPQASSSKRRREDSGSHQLAGG